MSIFSLPLALLACVHPEPTDSEFEWPTDGAVLDDLTVVDADGRRTGRAVVVVGDTIWTETEAEQNWPSTLEVRDLEGAVVIPGLIDSHVHLFHAGTTYWVGDTVAQNLRATLAWGVVGVQDLGGPEIVFSLRDRIAAGEILGPRVLATGPFLTAEGSHPCEVFYDPDLCVFVDGDGAARASVLRETGADRLKVALVDNAFTDSPVPRLDLGDLAEIVENGLPVVAHIASNADAADAFAAGVEAIAHATFSEPVDPSVAALPFSGVHTTVSAFAGIVEVVRDQADLSGERYEGLSDAQRESWAYIQEHPSVLADGFVDDSAVWADQARANLAVYREAHASLLPGSDAGYWFVAHGSDLHRELEEMVDAGFTPLEALTAATADAASALGWTDLGRVAEGYRADLVVLSGDPTEDIRNTRSVQAVLLGGEWWTPEALLEADLWRNAGGPFCLDDRDCAESAACDRVDHRCTAACSPTYATAGECDVETWCAPADGLVDTAEGVCHIGDACSWQAQDCGPESYPQTCVPADADTNLCWPAGSQGQGQLCSWTDSNRYCAEGLLCSAVTSRCYALCDPEGEPSCAVGSCHPEYSTAEEVWFGLCY